MAPLFLWADVPMDLDTPFVKTLILKKNTGVVEDREITGVKINEGKIESVTTKGVVALVPTNDVIAILPMLPDSGIQYELKDVERAISLLESLPTDLKQRPEASTEALQKWKDLEKTAEEAERKRKQKEADEEKKAAEEKVKVELDRLSSWLMEASDFQKPRSEEELEKLRVKGQNFLLNKTGDTAKVYDCLAVLSQVLPKEKGGPLPDLAKLSEVQSKIVPDDLLIWATAGILIASFFGLLMGLSFTSSGVTRLREGAVLGGVVFGGLGLAILAGLAAIWWPISSDGENISFEIYPSMERTIIFAKNGVKPAYYLPSSESKASGLEFASSLLASLPPSDDSSGMLKGKLKQGTLWIKADTWLWKQPVTALGIPIPVSFMFQGKIPKAKVWADISIEKVSLGRLTFPESLGSIFCDGMKSTIQSGLSSGGFTSIKVTQEEGGQLLISTQASGTKPKIEIKEEVKDTMKGVNADAIKTIYREKITAEDFAKLIAEGKAKEFLNKFIITEGEVYSVGGSNFSSSGKMGRDNTDDIYLIGIRNFYGPRPEDHLLIRCMIKSDLVFQMDSRGDLYARYVIQQFEQDSKRKTASRGLEVDGNNISFRTLDGKEVTTPDIDPVKERPLVQKGKKLTFLKPARVELDQKEVEQGKTQGGKHGRPLGTNKQGNIELYGITLMQGGGIGEIIEETDGIIPKTQ